MTILSTAEAVAYLTDRQPTTGKRRSMSERRLRKLAKAGDAPVWMRDERGYLFSTEQLDEWQRTRGAA